MGIYVAEHCGYIALVHYASLMQLNILCCFIIKAVNDSIGIKLVARLKFDELLVKVILLRFIMN